MGDYAAVLVTCPDERVAAKIASTVVSERLAACGQIVGPIRSIYRWKGDVMDEPEYLLIMKTKGALFEELGARVVELHPYEVPQVVALEIKEGSKDYLAWIEEETR